MKGDGVADELAGETIKDVFKNAEPVADLHACLTSSRGSNFRLRLLQALEVPLESDAIERLRIDAGINEYHRHLNMLLKFDLVCVQEIDGNKHYLHSELSERAVNGLHALGRRIGREEVDAIYAASLGPNSCVFSCGSMVTGESRTGTSARSGIPLRRLAGLACSFPVPSKASPPSTN